MTDKISREMRSKVMRSIRSKDTKPEISVRQLLTRLGYRYRLHKRGLPGHPDIVFAGRKKAIFIHGCFWHVHQNCSVAHIPASEYWIKKLARTQERDKSSNLKLLEMGWTTMTIWECELKDLASIENNLIEFIGPVRKG